MAKKKAQHLYELLGQKAQEAIQASRETSAKEPEAAPVPTPVPGQKPPRRRYVPGVSAPMQTPVPAAAGHEHALENVVTIRRDTAVVGVLMVIVLLVVAFVVGRATAPKYIEEKPLNQGLRDIRPATLTEPEQPEAPPTDREEEERAAAEEARRIVEEAAEPAAPATPEGKWYVQLGSYVESNKHMGEDVAKYLRDKKGYNAELARSGRAYMLRVIGYATKEEAQRAQVKLSGVEYMGQHYWPVDKTMVKKKD